MKRVRLLLPGSSLGRALFGSAFALAALKAGAQGAQAAAPQAAPAKAATTNLDKAGPGASANPGAAASPSPQAAALPRVQFAGQMGQRALLVIEGQAHMLSVGQSTAGVKLLSVADGLARIEHAGRTMDLRLGATPSTAGATASGSGANTIVLTAGLGGHFIADGAINGRAVRFMVDTGATTIAMGRDTAERIGIDWRNGEPGLSSTANGTVEVRAITLARVRVGEVEVTQVRALVVPAPMPYVLLGNSFLSRFQMERRNEVMRLELRR